MNFVSTLEKTSFPSGQWYGGQGKLQVRKNGSSDDKGYRQQQGQQNNGQPDAGHAYNIICKWEPFREQILNQWDRLTGGEVDAIGPNRSKLAMLIENKYGIGAHLVENYLRNFERTLPLI